MGYGRNNNLGLVIQGTGGAYRQRSRTREPTEGERRDRKILGHRQDYVCYSASPINPSSSTMGSSSLHKASLGKPYPIAHCVTCNKFSNTHRCYLATIGKIVETIFFFIK